MRRTPSRVTLSSHLQCVTVVIMIAGIATSACEGTGSLAGHTWRLERVVVRSGTEPNGSTTTRELVADSAPQVRLEMGNASGTRMTGTLVLKVPNDRTTRTVEINATEAPTGEVTLTASSGVMGSGPITLSGVRHDDQLTVVGSGTKEDFFLDSLLFRRVKSGDEIRTNLIVLQRGDSSLARNETAASVKSDLRNLVVAQEAFFADSVRYTRRLGQLVSFFAPNPGSTVEIWLSADGWWGRERLGSIECEIYVGSSRGDLRFARREGEPRCSTDR